MKIKHGEDGYQPAAKTPDSSESEFSASFCSKSGMIGIEMMYSIIFKEL